MVEPVVLYRSAASRMLGSSSPGLSSPVSMSLAISWLTCRYLAMIRTLPAQPCHGSVMRTAYWYDAYRTGPC
jgi:hypothetical protein